MYPYLPQKKQAIMLENEIGLLEGVFFQLNQVKQEKLALILPPDPTHKGTMNNKVVNMLFDNFERNGFATLKINYRGVGKSQGKAVSNEEKIVDALSALDWLIKKCESSEVPTPKICVAGFSLGGWIALQCAMRRPEITNFLIINTQLDPSEFNMLTPCPSGLIIQSDKDVLAKKEIVEKFHSQLITQKGCKIDFKSIDDDHYFSNNFSSLKLMSDMYVKNIMNKNTSISN